VRLHKDQVVQQVHLHRVTVEVVEVKVMPIRVQKDLRVIPIKGLQVLAVIKDQQVLMGQKDQRVQRVLQDQKV